MKLEPAYKLIWNGKDLTKDLSPYLTDLTFQDREEGESDELEFTLDDREGYWRNRFYPRKGDTVSLSMGWTAGEFDPCGSFQIDEIRTTISGEGHFIKVKALAAIITEALRTKKSARYEGITLKRLATTIASRGGMTMTGITDNLTLPGIAQRKETDLGFMRRVAAMYGYIFTIKDKRLVFTKTQTLQDRSPVKTLDLSVLDEVDITDATDLAVKAVRHTYWDPVKKKKVGYEYQGPGSSAKPDIMELDGHVSNDEQSELKAKAAWLKSNNGTVSGSISFSKGESKILAGNNVIIQRIGKISGIYHIQSTRHSVSFGAGARLTADVFKVGEISTELY